MELSQHVTAGLCVGTTAPPRTLTTYLLTRRRSSTKRARQSCSAAHIMRVAMGGLRASAVAVVVSSILWDSDAFACCAAPRSCKRIPVAPVAAAAAVTGSGEGVTTPPFGYTGDGGCLVCSMYSYASMAPVYWVPTYYCCCLQVLMSIFLCTLLIPL